MTAAMEASGTVDFAKEHRDIREAQRLINSLASGLGAFSNLFDVEVPVFDKAFE